MKFFVTLLFLSLVSQCSFAGGLKHDLKLVQCPGPSASYEAEFEGSLVLNENFLSSAGATHQNIKEGVLQELKYFSGIFVNNEKAKGRIVLSAREPRIDILSTKIVPYGQDLKIDWTPREDIEISNSYIKAAIARGKTLKDDRAHAVQFKIKFDLILCDPKETRLTIKYRVPLPWDPYLFYWMIQPQDRREIVWSTVRGVVNPCADVEVVDYPDPYYFWYFWDPLLRGRDAKGNSFDCRALISSGTSDQIIQANLTRVQRPKPNFKNLKQSLYQLRRPINATLIFGFIEHHSKEPTPKEISEIIDMNREYLLGQEGATRRDFSVDDWGTRNFLNTVLSLPRVMSIDTVSENSISNHLEVQFSGKFRASGRPLTLKMYIGPTDIFGPSNPEHWDFALQALAHDDIILYGGHSGLGNNFNLNQIAERLKMDSKSIVQVLRSAPAYQLVGYFSCISYTYFGQDLEKLSMALNDKRKHDFVYTGIPFSNTYQGVTATLLLVDKILSAHSPQQELALDSIVPKGDYLVFESEEVARSPRLFSWIRGVLGHVKARANRLFITNTLELDKDPTK